MIKKSYHITGFDCAHCALKSEKHLNKHPAINNAVIDFAKDKLFIEYKDKELEEKIPQIYKTSFGAKVQSWGEKGLFVPTGITALILFFVIVNKRFFYKVTIPFFGGEINVNKYGSVSTGFWFAVIGLALLAMNFGLLVEI